MTRARTALGAALAALLALTACRSGGGDDRPKVTVETRFLDRLSAAIASVNKARQAVANDANAIGTAAAAVDDVDAVAVTGDRTAVRAARPKAANAVAKAAPAARRLNKDVAAYDKAIAALDAAKAEGLDAAQRKAVQDVVDAARVESKQLHGYATAVATVWPRYEALDENQTLWLARSSNGWYRDQKEGAGAYVVLSERQALDRARRALATADSRRLATARTTDGAIARARGALAALLD